LTQHKQQTQQRKVKMQRWPASPMQSVTQSFSAAHMTLLFAFTTKRATGARHANQPANFAWRRKGFVAASAMSQRPFVGETSPWLGKVPRPRQNGRHMCANLHSAQHSLFRRGNRGLGFQ